MVSRLFPGVFFVAILACTLPGCASIGQCRFDGCRDDAKITAEVRALFGQYPVLEPPNLLTVQTTNRTVYLNGLVLSELARDTAETVALRVPGVAKGINGIAVIAR